MLKLIFQPAGILQLKQLQALTVNEGVTVKAAVWIHLATCCSES